MAESDSTLDVFADNLQGLRALVDLPAESVNHLLDALAASSPAIDVGGIVAQLDVPSIPETDISNIIEALFALSFARSRLALTPREIATEAARAAQEDGVVHSKAELHSLTRRLRQFLAVDDPLGVSSRALDVLTQNEYSFAGARILTDVRAVFSDETKPKPLAGMIVHNLELTCHRYDDEVFRFVAMDTADLRVLKAVIERAILKEAALEESIRSAGLHYIPVSNDRAS